VDQLRGGAAEVVLGYAQGLLGIAQRPGELPVAVDDPRQFLRAGVPVRYGSWVYLGTGIFIRWGGQRRRLARGGALACRAGVIFFGRGPCAGGA
jgi:hypothetical protein